MSRQFLQDGLFSFEQMAAPGNAVPDNVCVASGPLGEAYLGGPLGQVPWQRDFDTPPSASTHSIGPDPTVPLTSMFDASAGSPTGADRRSAVLSRLDQALQQQARRAQSQQGWQGHRSGPPVQRPPAYSRPMSAPPMTGRAVRGGAIASLVGGAMIGLNREAMVYALRSELDRMARQIRQRTEGGRGRVLCAAMYSFYTFTDDIGDNRPELAMITVYNPDRDGSGLTATASTYDLLSNAFPRPSGTGQSAWASPGFTRQYGDFERHGAPNRQRASVYVFASQQA